MPADRPDRTRPAEHPVRTFDDAQRRYDSTGPGTSLLQARERLESLTSRDLTARSVATLKACGEFDPVVHAHVAASQPLTADERLEVLALGELLARHYRHPTEVHRAVMSGLSWAHIAEAVGSSAEHVRLDYLLWADSQRQLWHDYEGKFGLSDSEYAIAVDRAARRPCERDLEAGR
jgi:hypothetical protein